MENNNLENKGKNRNKIDKTIIEDFLIYMRNIKEVSNNTIINYRIDLNMLFNYLLSNNIAILQEIELVHLHNFIMQRSQEGDSKKTRARRVSSIKSFFKYTSKILKITNDVAVSLEKPKLDKSLPHYLTLEQIKTLLQHLECKSNIRDKAIINLFLNTGLRLSELVSINMKDIRDDFIIIKGKGNKERIVYINNSAINVIRDYQRVRPIPKDNTDALFLSERKNRISVSAVQRLVKINLEKAGLQGYSVHSLRHSAATLMHKSGTDIRTLQVILGHSSISTTEIYTHVESDKLREAVRNNPLNEIEF